MKYLAAAILVGLVACNSKPPPPLPDPVDQTSCAGPVVDPLPPRKPRTLESIAAWGNATEGALRVANRRLVECEGLRARAVRLLER